MKIIYSKFFEWGITICILVNTIVMAMRFYRMSNEYEMFLEYLNYFFAMVFNLEMIIKLFGLGLYYFSTNWNRFDFIIVIGTNMGLCLRLFNSDIDFASAA